MVSNHEENAQNGVTKNIRKQNVRGKKVIIKR